MASEARDITERQYEIAIDQAAARGLNDLAVELSIGLQEYRTMYQLFPDHKPLFEDRTDCE